MKKIRTLGIDLAKSVFQLHGVDEHGVAVLRRQLRRTQLLSVLAQLPACLVAMEACASAHYWGRQIKTLGHEVKLIPPQYVKPFVRGNKTDRNDAQAICEAALRPDMPAVAVKSEEQQAMMWPRFHGLLTVCKRGVRYGQVKVRKALLARRSFIDRWWNWFERADRSPSCRVSSVARSGRSVAG